MAGGTTLARVQGRPVWRGEIYSETRVIGRTLEDWRDGAEGRAAGAGPGGTSWPFWNRRKRGAWNSE